MGYHSCRTYTTSHFYHSVGLQSFVLKVQIWHEYFHNLYSTGLGGWVYTLAEIIIMIGGGMGIESQFL